MLLHKNSVLLLVLPCKVPAKIFRFHWIFALLRAIWTVVPPLLGNHLVVGIVADLVAVVEVAVVVVVAVLQISHCHWVMHFGRYLVG